MKLEIYRRIIDSNDIENLQTDLNSLGEWAVENEMRINPGKSKAVKQEETAERLAVLIKDCVQDEICNITPPSFAPIINFEIQEPCK
jgi:transcriptional/translational regulatory protein YebC/TACO1